MRGGRTAERETTDLWVYVPIVIIDLHGLGTLHGEVMTPSSLVTTRPFFWICTSIDSHLLQTVVQSTSIKWCINTYPPSNDRLANDVAQLEEAYASVVNGGKRSGTVGPPASVAVRREDSERKSGPLREEKSEHDVVVSPYSTVVKPLLSSGL